MAYKKVKLLNETGDEELYPESDWSIIKNSPITTELNRIDMQSNGKIKFDWDLDATVNANMRVYADNISLVGEELYITDENTGNQPVLLKYYPRTEKAFEACPLNKFFGSVFDWMDLNHTTIRSVLPAIGIARINPEKGETYQYFFFNGRYWEKTEETNFIPINKGSVN